MQSGTCVPQDFDPRVVSALASLHNLSGLAIERFAASDFGNVRSKASFFMGALETRFTRICLLSPPLSLSRLVRVPAAPALLRGPEHSAPVVACSSSHV